LFEAEALRDGRLTGVEVARFQAHVRVCPICAREVAAMQALADALRASTDTHDADELHVRRERTRLLAAFDAALVPRRQSVRSKLWLPMAGALVVLAVLLLVHGRPRAVAPVPSAIEPVKVSADGTSKWTRRTENQTETLTLESGTLSIRVDHQRPHRRLLVVLPDGELEDIGTTFSVTAAAARTTQVSVQDGSVVLRLHDHPALTLRAGDSWTPAAAPEPLVTAPTAKTAVAPSLRSAKAQASPTAPSASSVEVPTPPTPDAAADFRAALAALTAGDNARASNLFADFLLQHARDPRAEDAAYLRVLAFQRGGDSSRMQQAAKEYLRRYPNGFRRAEIEPLSR
jgi:cytoskeletal protein RodZ